MSQIVIVTVLSYNGKCKNVCENWCDINSQISYFQREMPIYGESKCIEGDLLCETILTQLVSNSHRGRCYNLGGESQTRLHLADGIITTRKCLISNQF